MLLAVASPYDYVPTHLFISYGCVSRSQLHLCTTVLCCIAEVIYASSISYRFYFALPLLSPALLRC